MESTDVDRSGIFSQKEYLIHIKLNYDLDKRHDLSGH